MRDDEMAPTAGRPAAEEFARATGPRHAARRHAAPRKSLLTKFQMPAGKAMMFAAMPTAVVVGMGLTPRLALADDNTGSAAANPCVSRSDEPGDADSSSPSASQSAKPDPSASASSDTSKDKAGDKADDGGKTDGGSKAGGGSADPQPSATPSTTPSASHTPAPADSSPASQDSGGASGSGGGLLGGLGSAVGGLLGGHEKSSTSDATSDAPAPSSTPSAGSTAKSPSASSSSASSPSSSSSSKEGSSLGSVLGGSPAGTSKGDDGAKAGGTSKGASADPSGKVVKGTVGGLSKAKAGTAQTKTQAIKDLLTQKGMPFSDATADPKDAQAKADGGSCDDGPCDNLIPILKPPTQDTDALPMANDPWHLSSSNLGLHGLCYRGLVDIKTNAGVKRVMKFTADSIDISDLHQTVDNRDSHGNIVTHTQIKTAAGSKSTIDGPVTMYTEKLSGNMLGVLPITFTPDFPPPIQISDVFFTNATVDQAGQFGGTLTMKGLHNFISE